MLEASKSAAYSTFDVGDYIESSYRRCSERDYTVKRRARFRPWGKCCGSRPSCCPNCNSLNLFVQKMKRFWRQRFLTPFFFSNEMGTKFSSAALVARIVRREHFLIYCSNVNHAGRLLVLLSFKWSSSTLSAIQRTPHIVDVVFSDADKGNNPYSTVLYFQSVFQTARISS